MINILIFLIGAMCGMMAIYPYFKCVIDNLNNEIYYNNKGINIRDEKIKHLKEQLQNNKI